MSEDSKPPEAPPGASVPPTGTTPAQPAGTTPATPATTPSTAPMGSRPPGPPIDILMPTPKKPFTIPAYAGCFVKMVFGFTVLLIMGYCALVALNPKAQKWATQGAKDGSGGPTPFNAVNQILAIPAQAIGKTKDVVAKSDARVGVLDNVIATDEKAAAARKEAKPLTDPFGGGAATANTARAKGAAEDQAAEDNRISREALLAKAARDTAEADAKPKPAPPRPVATTPPPPPGPPELKLPGGITLTNSSPAGAPPASAPFMYWVAGQTISGISNSTPPRFLMNNKLVREGDEVNKQLGITFNRLDAAAKLIYFRDKDGAVVTRSY